MTIDKKFIDQIIEVSSRAAYASSHLVGKNDKIAADKAAVDAMRQCLNKMDINGKVVIGEGELDEAHKLLEASQARLEELEADVEALNKEKEGLSKKFGEKETRAKTVLQNAKNRIQKVEEERNKLQKELDEALAGSSNTDDQESEFRRKALTSQVNQLRQDKEKLETEKNEAVSEKERLMEQVEALQQELGKFAGAQKYRNHNNNNEKRFDKAIDNHGKENKERNRDLGDRVVAYENEDGEISNNCDEESAEPNAKIPRLM